jgi:hypothetical protein
LRERGGGKNGWGYRSKPDGNYQPMNQSSTLETKRQELYQLQEEARKKTRECGDAVRRANQLEKEIKELQKKEMEKQ